MSDVNLGTASGLIQFSFDGAGAAAAILSLTSITAASETTSAGLRNLGLGAAAAGALIDEALKGAVDSAINYQQQIALIGVATNDNTKSAAENKAALDQVSAGLKGIAESTPTSISGINAVADALAQQGIRGADLVSETKNVIDLQNLTGESAESLITPLTKLVQAQNLGAQGFNQYANGLFEANRQTSATIPNILDFQTKLEGASKALGLTASQSLALSAFLGTVPAQGRTVVTTINQLASTFTAGALSASQLGEFGTLAFGNVANAGQRFADELRTDPVQAIAALLTGMGNAKDGGETLGRVMDDLGLKQQRQQITTEDLALTQQSLAGSGRDLGSVVKLVGNAFGDQTSIQNATQQAYATTSARLTILHSDISFAAIGFANELLPAINLIIPLVERFASGMERIVNDTGPVIPILATAAAITLTLGGAYLLLAPRIASAAAAWGVLTGAKAADAAATADDIGATDLLETGISVLIAGIAELNINLGQIVDLMGGVGISTANIVDEMILMAEATGEAEAALGGLDVALVATDTEISIATGGINLIIPALAGIATALGIGFVGAANSAGASAKTLAGNLDPTLLNALQNTTAGVDQTTNAWILNQLTTSGALKTWEDAGGKIQDLVNYIKGGGKEAIASSGQTLADYIQYLGLTGSKASDVQKEIEKLTGQYVDTTAAAKALTTATGDLGGAQGSADAPTTKFTDDIQTLDQQLSKLAEDEKNYVTTSLDVDKAQLQVADSQQKVADAAQNLADKGLQLNLLNNKIADDNAKIADANAKLATDEIALSQARVKQQEDLAKAQDDLANAQDRQKSDAVSLQEAQLKLNDLQNGGAQLNYVKTINALHDANEKLVESNVSVQDAQYQLNFLQGEGAGARDIEAAHNTLTDALDKQTAASASAQEAQQKVNDLPTQQAIDMAKAQNSVADALQRQKDDAQAVVDAQTKIQTIQAAIANDTAYKAALAAISQDHIDIDNAILSEHRDLQDLHNIEDGSLERAYQSAVDDLYSSVDALATKTTDLQIEQDQLNGHLDTGQEMAQKFATNLAAVVTQAGLANTPLATLDQTVQQFMLDISSLLNPTASLPTVGPLVGGPTTGGPIGQAALGGVTTSDGLLYVHDNEVIAPLDDVARAYALLSGSGLLDNIGNYIAGTGAQLPAPPAYGTPSGSVPISESTPSGDHFHLTSIQGATAPEVVREFTWARLVRTH